jgi:hypothetical protein
MHRINRTIDRYLTLLEVSKGLEDQIAVGGIEVETVQRLNSLAQLMHYLDEEQAKATSTMEPVVIQLTHAIAKGKAVEVELISAAQS